MTSLCFSQAMVLAAGRGVRLQPLTHTTPKPLIPVQGRPMLDSILDDLAAFGVEEVVLNIHHLAEQFEDFKRHREVCKPDEPRLLLSDERGALLETGGGVKRALPLLHGDPLLILNSDVLWQGGLRPILSAMIQRWDPARMDVLLLLVPMAFVHGFDGQGDYAMDADQRLTLARTMKVVPAELHVYAGVQITRRFLFDEETDTTFRCTNVWAKAEAQGRLFGYSQATPWFHVGDTEGWRQAQTQWRATVPEGA